MVQNKISIFSNVGHLRSDGHITVTEFLDRIQNGYWQDLVLPIRAEKDIQVRTVLKKQVPNVTLSGLFHERTEEGMIVHSGLIGIDIDDVDPEDTKGYLCVDPHVYAAFTSISGTGLCVIFIIDGKNHRELFEGIQEYLFNKYRIVIDPTSVNLSRVRYVSYDPHLYINDKAERFTYIPEKVKEEKASNILFTETDYDMVMKQILDNKVDITQGYKTWLKLGFAISDKFGESGREDFHKISQFHPNYTRKETDKQYTACLKGRGYGVSISTFFYYAKQNGLKVISPRTEKIYSTTDQLKGQGKTKEEIKSHLASEGIKGDDVDEILDQVKDDDEPAPKKKTSLIEIVSRHLKQNYDIRKNCITRKIEIDGVPIDTFVENTIYLEIKQKYDKATFDLVDRCIFSNRTPMYNPFTEWLDAHKDRNPSGLIETLFDSIESDTGLPDNPEFKLTFGRKWMVGLIAAMHGEVVPIMLVLCGTKQNTGKTEWFRRLLPNDLKEYYAESKLDMGKDDEILMTQKLMIVDDEMGGKSKLESKRLKELTSKEIFSLREPYGRQNVDLKRLAVLGGTSNDPGILNDPTGNRRIIPINVLSIDHRKYNSIDKTDLLIECYWLYKSGFDFHLSNAEIKVLNNNTEEFEQTSREYELFNRYFRLPMEGEECDSLTNSEICMKIEQLSSQRISQHKIGMELQKMGLKRYRKWINNRVLWVYDIIQKIHQ